MSSKPKKPKLFPDRVTEFGIPSQDAYEAYLKSQMMNEGTSGIGNYAAAIPLTLGGGAVAALGPTGIDKMLGLMMLSGGLGYGVSGYKDMKQASGLHGLLKGAKKRRGNGLLPEGYGVDYEQKSKK